MVIGVMVFCSNVNGGTRTWNGSISSDWNTAANWNEGLVPNSDDDVIISISDPWRNCELTSSATIKSLRIEISYGSEFILSSGNTLSITGDLYIDAPFLPWQNTSNIIFTGAGEQNITIIDPFGDYYFYNLTINKPSGTVILNSDITITGTFNIISGNIDCNGFSGPCPPPCTPPVTGGIYHIANDFAF